MKKLALPAVGACAGLLATTGAALAAGLPSLKSDLIVPNKSLGIPLYGNFAAAKRAFRSGGASCSTRKGCSFQGADGSGLNILFATTRTHRTPFVAQVTITAPLKAVGSKEILQLNTPLAAFKTSSGIGLGSTAKAVKAAYPKATGSPATGYSLKGPGMYGTTFGMVGGRVSFIATRAVDIG